VWWVREGEASVRESPFYMRRVTWAKREFILAEWDWSRPDRNHQLEFVTVWCSASLTFLLLAWQVKQLITATKYRKWRASFRKARQPGHSPAPVTHSALPLRPPSGRPLSGDSVESKPNHGAWLYKSSLWIIPTSILLYFCIYVYLWIPSNYRIIAAV